MKSFRILLAAALCFCFAAPVFAAESVGRVVAYDKDAKKVTFIEDKLGWSNPGKPEFSVLPAKEFVLPDDPGDMAPKAGGRLRVDYEKKEIIIYNPSSKTIDTIAFDVISKADNVEPDSALVMEDGKKKVFPALDKAKNEVTIYSPRQKNVSTIRVPAKYMELPPAVWDNGNDVKVTYDEPGKATGFTNISKSK